MLASEYAATNIAQNRKRSVKDFRCQPKLQRLGWIVGAVIAEDREDDIIVRVDDALSLAGVSPRLTVLQTRLALSWLNVRSRRY